VKAELGRVQWRRADAAWAELAALCTLCPDPEGIRVRSAAVARRGFLLAKQLKLAPRLVTGGAGDRRSFVVAWPALDPAALRRLNQAKRREPAAWLRGAVLARGYVAPPDHAYHVEVTAPTAGSALQVLAAMARLGVEAQQAKRRTYDVVYVKDKEQVGILLAHIGAHRARLLLESQAVMKSMKADVNRQVNGEAANLRRAVESGVAQEKALRRVRDSTAWTKWPKGFRELAELRLDHPDWTLDQLGHALVPPLTKSGVAYRLGRMVRDSERGERPSR